MREKLPFHARLDEAYLEAAIGEWNGSRNMHDVIEGGSLEDRVPCVGRTDIFNNRELGLVFVLWASCEDIRDLAFGSHSARDIIT